MPNKTYRLYPTEDYILAIEASFLHLADDPLISRQCDYVRQGLRVFNIGSHVIFFKITNYGIAVIRILHQSMDFQRHF